MNDMRFANAAPASAPRAGDARPDACFQRGWRDQAICPNCAGQGMTSFYYQSALPVHTIVQVTDAAEARDYFRRPLTLAHCPRCDFIANIDFDPAAHAYAPDYEETQHFSPTFSRFAEQLAEQLAGAHDLTGKTILEVGCGKGEFLTTLCQVTGARGIGIDPAVVPQRIDAGKTQRIQFIQGFFPDQTPDQPVDFICCRHTLEHIPDTRAFLGHMRRWLKDDRKAAIFIEVPAAERVITDGIFWDVYYEHCSYFTEPALHRLMRTAGLQVTSSQVAYDQQYLLMTAQPDGHTSPPVRAESAPIDRYRDKARQRIEAWRSAIDNRHAAGQRIVLWGSGSKGVAFLTTLGLGPQIQAVVDINPYRHGKAMLGTAHRIVGPDQLHDIGPDLVIAMNPIYRDEIQQELDRRGVDAQLLAAEDLP